MTFRITWEHKATGRPMICGSALTYEGAVDEAENIGYKYRGEVLTIYHSDNMWEPLGEVVVPKVA